MLWKCCTQYASKYGKLSSGHRTGKDQFSFQSQRKAIPLLNCSTVALISHASKVMLKILQARLQQYVNWELPDGQPRFKKSHRGVLSCSVIGKVGRKLIFSYISNQRDWWPRGDRLEMWLILRHVFSLYCDDRETGSLYWLLLCAWPGLPHAHLTHQQSNAQNSPCQASTVCELRTSTCSSWI